MAAFHRANELMEDDQHLDRMKRRFERLADNGDDGPIPGAAEIGRGIARLAEHLQPGDGVDTSAIADHFQAIASALEPDGDRQSAADDHTAGLGQFVDSFQSDASKRIQGLSISLMGIFGGVGTEEALDQSTDHLHAIRGSAAMLGLNDIATLAAEMEQTLLANEKLAPEHRQWPTRPLLRGYALLEEAVDADPPAVDREELDEVLTALGATPLPEDTSDELSTSADGGVSRETSDRPTPPPAPRDVEQPILVVDDVDAIAASVGFILSELDVPVEVASDGDEALQMLEQQPFSLVISDVDMPRMDGIALTRAIRSNDELGELPVILLTSLDDPQQRQKGLDSGANDYIIKGSIGGGELLHRVRELLQVAPVVDRARHPGTRHILIAEDTETVAASIAFVLSEGPFEITLANDGKDALRRLERESFDLLITDLQMPYITGTELVRSVRSDPDVDDLPIIMLTSVEDDDAIQEAVDAGVDRYMIKGEIAGGKLLDAVEALLS